MATTPMAVKQTAPAPAAGLDTWHSLRSEMDRLFDRLSVGFGMPTVGSMFNTPRPSQTVVTIPTPAVDIAEDAAAFHLTAELPGMTEQDIEVTMSGDTLVIKGEKKQESERQEKDTHLSERSYGMFQRSFVLPDGVDRDRIEASFGKGVLTLTLPKTPAATVQPKKIDIKAAS